MTTDWQTAVAVTLELMAIVGTVVAILALRRSRDEKVALASIVEDLSCRLRAVEATFWEPRETTEPLPSTARIIEETAIPTAAQAPASPEETSRRSPSPVTPEVRQRPAPASLGLARRQANDSPAGKAHRAIRQARRRIDRAGATPVPRTTLIAVPSMATAGADTLAREASSALARRFGPIWDLADSGRTPGAIAQETGQPIGQVELILGLRRPSDGQDTGEAVPNG